MQVEFLLLILSLLFFVSIFADKIGYKYGVPALLLFLAVGMFFGSHSMAALFGMSGVTIETGTAQALGTMAMCIILFTGGLETKLSDIKSVSLFVKSLADGLNKSLNISLNEDGSYTVCVNWPDSAFQTYSWNLTGTFDESETAGRPPGSRQRIDGEGEPRNALPSPWRQEDRFRPAPAPPRGQIRPGCDTPIGKRWMTRMPFQGSCQPSSRG